jgi:peptidyl-dipeptidase Dcp
MKKTLLLALSSLTLIACNNPTIETNNKQVENKNPILQEWDTPFGLPPFNKIKSEDYLPAYKTAIIEHKAEIEAIIVNEEAPTFSNTIEALEFADIDSLEKRSTQGAQVKEIFQNN